VCVLDTHTGNRTRDLFCVPFSFFTVATPRRHWSKTTSSRGLQLVSRRRGSQGAAERWTRGEKSTTLKKRTIEGSRMRRRQAGTGENWLIVFAPSRPRAVGREAYRQYGCLRHHRSNNGDPIYPTSNHNYLSLRHCVRSDSLVLKLFLGMS